MASRILESHPEADAELEQATIHYTAIDARLGRRFLDLVIAAKNEVLQHPERWPEHLEGTHRYRLDTFPFAFIYVVRNDSVFVVAFAHVRRKPGYWIDRLSE